VSDPKIAAALRQAEKRERDERKKAAAKRKEDRRAACTQAGRRKTEKKSAVRKNDGKGTRSENEGRRMNEQKNGGNQIPVKERSEKKSPVCGKVKTKNVKKEKAVQGTSEKTKKNKVSARKVAKAPKTHVRKGKNVKGRN
jgi:hypothetical protein